MSIGRTIAMGAERTFERQASAAASYPNRPLDRAVGITLEIFVHPYENAVSCAGSRASWPGLPQYRSVRRLFAKDMAQKSWRISTCEGAN